MNLGPRDARHVAVLSQQREQGLPDRCLGVAVLALDEGRMPMVPAMLCSFLREGSQHGTELLWSNRNNCEMGLLCTCPRVAVLTLEEGRMVGGIRIALLMLHEDGQPGTGLL